MAEGLADALFAAVSILVQNKYLYDLEIVDPNLGVCVKRKIIDKFMHRAF